MSESNKDENINKEDNKSPAVERDNEQKVKLTVEEKLKIGQSMAISKKDRDSVIDIINNDIPVDKLTFRLASRFLQEPTL